LLYSTWAWMSAVAYTLRHREEGATMVEYGLMVALIAVVCIAIVTLVGEALRGKFDTVNTNLGG
jgi:pilus assembly protein Flp/PilA